MGVQSIRIRDNQSAADEARNQQTRCQPEPEIAADLQGLTLLTGRRVRLHNDVVFVITAFIGVVVVLTGITGVVQTIANFSGQGFFESEESYVKKQVQKVANVKFLSIVFLVGLVIAGGSAAVITL